MDQNPQYQDVLAATHPLIATGTMAFTPKHELPRLAIEWIKNNDINVHRTGKRAWRTVGPGLLTRLYHSHKWDDITILPSYYFYLFTFLDAHMLATILFMLIKNGVQLNNHMIL